MKGKFNNPEGNNQEGNKLFSKEEMDRAFLDLLIDSSMHLLGKIKGIEDIPRQFKSKAEEDFNKFITILNEYFEKHKKIIGSFEYIQEKDPNNIWLDIIEIIGSSGQLDENNSGEIFNLLKEKIKKRREGADIQ